MQIVPNNKEQIQWIDLAKGICILLVVFYHATITSYQIPNVEISGIQALSFKVYEMLSVKLVPLRMPLFFMISGFLVYRGVKNYSWNKVWYGRIQTIWYVYLLWSVIQWTCVSALMLFSGSIFLESNTSLSNYANDVPTFLLLVAQGSSSLWYLYVLPIYFIICKVLSSKPIFCIALLMAANILSEYYNLQFPTNSIVKNGVFYAIGCFLCPTILPMVSKLRDQKKIFVLIGSLLFTKFIMGVIGIELRLTNAILIVAAMVLFLNWFQERWDIFLLRWIGKNTLSIYVLHQVFLKLLSIIIVPALITAGFFTNSAFLTFWYISYPVLAVVFMTGGSLVVWKLTDRGFGKYLYKSPKSS